MSTNDNFLASFTGGRANGRRNVQIVGGGFNGLRTTNGYGSGDNPIEGIPATGNGFGMMHTMGAGPNDTLYNPQGYPNELGQNGYAGFLNGGTNQF